MLFVDLWKQFHNWSEEICRTVCYIAHASAARRSKCVTYHCDYTELHAALSAILGRKYLKKGCVVNSNYFFVDRNYETYRRCQQRRSVVKSRWVGPNHQTVSGASKNWFCLPFLTQVFHPSCCVASSGFEWNNVTFYGVEACSDRSWIFSGGSGPPNPMIYAPGRCHRNNWTSVCK